MTLSQSMHCKLSSGFVFNKNIIPTKKIGSDALPSKMMDLGILKMFLPTTSNCGDSKPAGPYPNPFPIHAGQS